VVDNTILIEGGIIILFGTAYVVQHNKPETPVLAGAIGVLLLVGLLEVFGGGPAKLGKALLTLATFSVIIVEGGSLFAGIQHAISNPPVSTLK
jgi:hypothetical protein